MTGARKARDPERAAASAGLGYVNDEDAGVSRRKAGSGFKYRDAAGRPVDAKTAARIRALAIPPAWTEVWICPHANGHIQATGRDARGRKQYRYHAGWSAARDESKYEQLLTFAKMLPKIRRRVRRDIERAGLNRDKVAATIVCLLETTLIRIGNREYARTNKSFGLTTLQDQHVQIAKGRLKFSFKGKSGKTWNLAVEDRRIARIVKSCQDLPGQTLFQFEDDDGALKPVTSDIVNEYLREICGAPVTAKDFRTWSGTVLAAMALAEFSAFDSEAMAKRNVRAAIESVAARLGNTPTICRKCYVHPAVVDCYVEGALADTLRDRITKELKSKLRELSSEEAVTLALLRNRLKPARTSKKAIREGFKASLSAQAAPAP